MCRYHVKQLRLNTQNMCEHENIEKADRNAPETTENELRIESLCKTSCVIVLPPIIGETKIL